MSNKLLFFVFTTILLTSCITPKNIPSTKKLDVDMYGAQIKVQLEKVNKQEPRHKINGELIAVENDELVILSIDTGLCTVVPKQTIKKFSIQYAHGKDLAYAIPVSVLVTISHGFFLFLTAPINLINTAIIASKKNTNYRFKKSEITYDDLKMFARFPQGIPLNVDIKQLDAKTEQKK